ncbi:hypothetical protein AA309_05530 [Microvirga vignae]|uniref:Uncharacterized protein n=2 Tax=Microvirga vignae TaxID=1225564 RepID=A0A0H1RGI2_9HYPH|nr:hypothetical protein AA309_05530 [Microvirga vignae]
MAAMDTFDHILNWTLKQGSHTFPGQDGGTCINEAAVVAAGFPYRPVRSVQDMPDCFSRPICALAMQLNDEATDEERQHLLPFVTRLACADTPEVEREREVYIASRLRHHLPFRGRLEILRGALTIGRHADLLGPEEVRTRMAVVQQSAATPTSVADHPMFAKIKSWFGSAKKAEPAN